jgi:hypothetical protein
VATKNKWEKGMKEEIDSLVNKHTCDSVQLHAIKRSYVCLYCIVYLLCFISHLFYFIAS